MKFKDIIGINTKSKLVKWINDYIDGKTDKYLILYGQSGNGKTFLTKMLAKEAGMEVFIIEPENVNSQDDINNIIKGINSSFNERLILIDDYDYFNSKYRTKLSDIPKISNYPIVYTSSTWCFDSNFLKDGLLIKLKKPLTSELRKFLMDNYGADYDTADKLASESKSIRSAILGLGNNTTNDLVRDIQTNYKTLQDLKERRLQGFVDRTNINWLYNSIRGYNGSALAVMLEFAEYDYKIKSNFETIDPFVVNNMKAPIEDVTFKQVFKIPNNNNKKPKKEEKKVVIKNQDKKFTSIDSFI